MDNLKYNFDALDRARLGKGWSWERLFYEAGLSNLATTTKHKWRPTTWAKLARAVGVGLQTLVVDANETDQ